MKKICFTLPVTLEVQEQLRQQNPEAEILFFKRSEVTAETLQDVHAVIGNVSAELLNQAPALEWVQLESAGADRYVSALKDSVLLTNASGAYGAAIAEHMIAAVFYFAKRLDQYSKAMSQHLWNNLGEVECVGEDTVCILGYGDIGQAFGQRMKAMGSRIIGVKRTASFAEGADELITMDRIKEVLPKANVVAMCLPDTPLTHQIMNEELLRLCRKDAILLNVGRGVTLDTDTLMNVLNED